LNGSRQQKDWLRLCKTGGKIPGMAAGGAIAIVTNRVYIIIKQCLAGK